jgi:poly(A) polymerase
MHKKAKSIVKKLHDQGYQAYFAGGWVRDFILGLPSDDIDIATSAPPEVIQKLFGSTIPIGAAFGIILVVIDKHQYEVATFRKDLEYKDGRRPTSIEFSTAMEDARRRDFTINGMFFDPLKEEIIDYVEGRKDLEKKVIRAIGNPHERIKEDRLRMLRAVRLAARFNFEIEEETKKAIIAHAKELFPFVAIERIWQELSKMAKYPTFALSLKTLYDFAILQEIFPYLKSKDRLFLENQTKYLDSFPKEAPTISKILDLFPDISLEEKIDLCKYLKLSNEEINFVENYHKISSILMAKEECSDYLWAELFATKNSDLIFQIIAAHLSLKEKQIFMDKIEKKKNLLNQAIMRIISKNPLVKASHLMKCGIPPGPNLGKLLKEAEEISINQKINEVEKIIPLLKKSTFWPKSNEKNK